MVSTAEMAADPPDVHLLYNPAPPEQYTARLGRTGWTAGSGFAEPEAFASLARAVIDDPSIKLPQAVSRAVESVEAWLATANSEATLDE